MSNTLPTLRRSQFLLSLTILAYAFIAGLYAVYTPAWQAPDEPAHYNYIRDLAETGRIPVIQPGDYDQAYLEEIKARRFPTDMPIDRIRYESHQPPLYYLLATPVYWLSGGRLVALRLFSVLLEAGLLLVTYRVISIVFPRHPGLALGGTAFVAFLPQHVAMSAAVNNDVLGELILAGCAALSLAYLRGGGDERHDRRLLLGLGVIMGLGFLTKTTAYLALPLALLAIVWRGAGSNSDLGRRLSIGLAPGLLLGLPWWVRNWVIYGPGDILGLRQHDAVVVGQPRTGEWLAQMGLGEFLRQAGTTTFRSFWGQFGWMGVLMDSRIYLVLGILSGVVVLGCLWALWEMLKPGSDRYSSDRFQRQAPGFMLVWLLLTALTYVWYNLTFVQHQGRYLFPALPVWGMGFALGLDQALRPRTGRWLAGLLLAFAVITLGLGVVQGDVNKWAVVLSGGAAFALAAVSLTPERWRAGYLALIYLGLAAFDLLALFGFIVPQLRM